MNEKDKVVKRMIDILPDSCKSEFADYFQSDIDSFAAEAVKVDALIKRMMNMIDKVAGEEGEENGPMSRRNSGVTPGQVAQIIEQINSARVSKVQMMKEMFRIKVTIVDLHLKVQKGEEDEDRWNAVAKKLFDQLEAHGGGEKEVFDTSDDDLAALREAALEPPEGCEWAVTTDMAKAFAYNTETGDIHSFIDPVELRITEEDGDLFDGAGNPVREVDPEDIED